MNTNSQPLSYSVSSFQTQSPTQNEKKNLTFYSSSAPYALKKRLIAPKWWVESLLLTLGKKHKWHASLMDAQENQTVHECFKVTSKNVFFMFLLWHELAQQMFSAQNAKVSKVRIEISQYLFGTDEENHAFIEKLEETLITPIKIFRVQKSNETNQCALAKSGFINIFRKISINTDDSGIWLTAHLAQKLSSLFILPDTKQKDIPEHTDYFTINPNLFYAMGSRVNLKKVLDTLYSEYSKQAQSPVSSPLIETPDFVNLDDVKLFSEPPTDELHKVRNIVQHADAHTIARIRKTEAALERKKQKLNMQSEIKSENLDAQVVTLPINSDKTQQAQTDAQPTTEARSTQSNITNESGTEMQKIAPAQCSVSEQTIASVLPTEATLQQSPNFQKSTEREFRIFVSRFYESLNPRQKKIFEREQQGMTGQQFRSFMIPILHRNLSTILTAC